MKPEGATSLHTRLLGLVSSLESIQRGRTALWTRDLAGRLHAALRELVEILPGDPRLSSWVALPLQDLEALWVEDENPHTATSARATRQFRIRLLKVGLLVVFLKLKYNDFFDAERSFPWLWEADSIDDLSDREILTHHTFLDFQVSKHELTRRRSSSCPATPKRRGREEVGAAPRPKDAHWTKSQFSDQPSETQSFAKTRTCSDSSQDDCNYQASSTISKGDQAESQRTTDFLECLPQTPRDIPLDWQSPSVSEGPWAQQISQTHQLNLPPTSIEADPSSPTKSPKPKNRARTANTNVNIVSSGRWWVALPDVCPVSNFPVRHLPYPPFRLYHRFFSQNGSSKKRADSRDVFVDALVVVLQAVKSMSFTVLGHDMPSGLMKALDFHVRNCKLGPFRLQKALQLQEVAKTSQEKLAELLEIQHAAGRRLSQLRSLQYRRKSRGFDPTPASQCSTSGKGQI